ncbi:MAG: PD-(D/E)XK nuclease family protein, partial [Egibacteraceae bacterium]
MADISLHSTPYGRPAAELLRVRVSAAKVDDPLQPVTVVVPTNYVGVSTRRLLAGGELGPVTARGAGVAGLNLLTVYRLAELLGAPRLAAQGRRPVSTPVVAAAVRSVLTKEPGIFEPVREHPSTEEALVRSYRELSELRESSLDALAGMGIRASEVVRVRRDARALLADAWFEEADLMAAATAAVRAGSTVLDDLGTVVVYLPQDLSLPAAALLRQVADRASVEVIAGRTGVAGADADIDRILGRLGLEPPSATHHEPPTPTAVISVSDPEEEVRTALERIVAAARDGVALERMALLYPAPEPYARLVAEQLDAAGVACNGRAVRPLADRMLGRWLLDLLALADTDYARPALMGLLAGAPVRGPDGRWIAAGAWERISREAGIVRGRGEWADKLAWFATDKRHRAAVEDATDDPRAWMVDRHRRDADRADELRAFVGELCDQLATAQRLDTWRQLAEWCQDTVRRYLGGDRARARWPEVERAAADTVDEALDRLGGLDAIEGATDLDVFRRTLRLELDADLGRVGAFGRGVLVGTVSAALGVDLDLVVVLGLAEGVTPSRPREDSLLPDVERAGVGDELRLRTDHVGVEHRHLLAALAAARSHRVLTSPRGDLRRSIERAPSRWLRAAAPGPATTVASFAQRVRTVAFPATRQEYGLRALADATRRDLPRHPLVAGDPALRAGVAMALTRGRRAFTRFDGNLASLGAEIASPADPDRVVSASQLETWLKCPHAYLLQYVLRVQPVDYPEELLEIDPMERGSLIHEVLEAWLDEQLAAGPPGPAEPWPPAARARMRALAEEACDAAEQRGVTGYRLLWRRDRPRIVADLERFVDHDDARRRTHELVPQAAEWAFGIPGHPAPAVAIDLGDGRAVRV